MTTLDHLRLDETATGSIEGQWLICSSARYLGIHRRESRALRKEDVGDERPEVCAFDHLGELVEYLGAQISLLRLQSP